MRVLAITNLFPNPFQPNRAPFNRQQFVPLGKLADVEVFGVVPWRFGSFHGGRGSSKDVVKEVYSDQLRQAFIAALRPRAQIVANPAPKP